MSLQVVWNSDSSSGLGLRLRLAHLTERVHHYSYNVRVRLLVDSLQELVCHETPELLHCLGAWWRAGGRERGRERGRKRGKERGRKRERKRERLPRLPGVV